jgi:hypothetical protein
VSFVRILLSGCSSERPDGSEQCILKQLEETRPGLSYSIILEFDCVGKGGTGENQEKPYTSYPAQDSNGSLPGREPRALSHKPAQLPTTGMAAL